MSEFNALGLSLAAINERLDRIENLLGVTDLTPSHLELEAGLLAEDLNDWGSEERP